MSQTTGRPDRDRCLLTIDVEEYFQGEAFDGAVSPGDWEYLPSRLEPSVELWLARLEEGDARATFFFLGWVADRHPHLVRRVAAAGHEVASRGWTIDPVITQSEEELRHNVRRARERLTELAGRAVQGFRAARPVAASRCEELFDALLEEGHLYDSSLLRLRRGMQNGPNRGIAAPCIVDRPTGRLLELPIGGPELGARGTGGLGYGLRHLPYGLARRRIRAALDRGGRRVRLRSWEIDPEQPHLPIPLLGRFRHYRRLDRVGERLGRLLSEFHFTSIAEAFGLERGSGAETWEAHGLPGTHLTAGGGA